MALIPIDDARRAVLAATHPLQSERVEVEQALDRVLVEDVLAAGDVPPFACSAMDGYALLAGPAGRTLTVIAESRAGAPTAEAIEHAEAIRISTGAAIPPGATAVIRQEDTETGQSQSDTVRTTASVAPGENIRGAGEAMRAGARVLAAGTRLGPAELAAAVAAGLGVVVCGRRPRVAVLCTGDELRAPGDALGPGEIHNSNAPMLAALATRAGAISHTPERLRDDRAATVGALRAAMKTAEVIIVSGGVSVGPHDHVKPALAELGVREVFWGVDLQPGKPTWFGTGDATIAPLVFGLPGNPVSAFVTFTLFVGPALAQLQGATAAIAARERALLAAPVRRNPARVQAVRVRLDRRGAATVATVNGDQGSHVMTSLLGADALAFIPSGDGELPAGAPVTVESLPS